MRKLKRYDASKKKKIITFVVIMFTALLIMASGYAIFNVTLTIQGTTKLVNVQPNHCDGSLTGTFEMDTNSWSDPSSSPVLYNSVGHLTLHNGGLETIYDLDLELQGDSDLSATAYKIEVHANSAGIIKSNSFFWNSVIAPDESKTYDIAFKSYTPIANVYYVKINGCVIYSDGSVPVTNDTTISTESTESTTTGNPNLYHISITPATVKMTVGETVPLQLEKNPADSAVPISWSSSAPSVAQVAQDGTVSGLAPGTATITAEGNGLTATCTITVKPVFNPSNISSNLSITNTYGDTAVFSLVITNNTDYDIDYYKIRLSTPTDCTYSSWGNFTFTGNEIESPSYMSPAIGAHTSITLQGSIQFPTQYLTTDDNYQTVIMSQYLSPTATVITVE